jgi:TonB family protein
MIWTKASALVMMLAISAISLAQNPAFGDPDNIIAGPYGEPRMVMDEGGGWSYPIKLFSNNAMETFTPDITSDGWVSWHIAAFQRDGTYFTYLYVYDRNSHKAWRDTVYVDTREGTVLVVRPLQAPERFNISKAPLELSGSLPKITEIVKKGAQEYRGMSAQESIQKQKYAVSRMVACIDSGPDCNLSDSDYEKKYPITGVDSGRLFDGAKPGLNCGIGNLRSCYYYDPENVAIRLAKPASPITSMTEPIVTENGQYRIGGRVSVPIVLHSVDPAFSEEARQAKHEGVCIVSLMIDTQGNPQDIGVARSLGMGLDEKALEAVRQFKFRPALLDGITPVPVRMTIEIKFHLY